jgi:hypothetical protein
LSKPFQNVMVLKRSLRSSTESSRSAAAPSRWAASDSSARIFRNAIQALAVRIDPIRKTTRKKASDETRIINFPGSEINACRA